MRTRKTSRVAVDPRTSVLIELARGPGMGQQLVSRLRERLADATPFRAADIYPTLQELTQQGLVERVPKAGQQSRGATYRLTEQGRVESARRAAALVGLVFAPIPLPGAGAPDGLPAEEDALEYLVRDAAQLRVAFPELAWWPARALVAAWGAYTRQVRGQAYLAPQRTSGFLRFLFHYLHPMPDASARPVDLHAEEAAAYEELAASARPRLRVVRAAG